MKTSEVLRKAAKNIEDGHNRFACFAIDDERDSFSGGDKACAYLKSWLAPRSPHYTWLNVDEFGGADSLHQKDFRILALCLAAAIAESEGD